MRLAVVLALASGCTFEVTAAPGDAGHDARPDAPTDTSTDVPTSSEFGDVDLVPVVEEYAALGNWTVDNVMLDTRTLMSSVSVPPTVMFSVGVLDGGGPVAYLRVNDFTLHNGTTMRVTGSYPLVIIAAHDVTIAGTIDLGARGSTAGAGGYLPAMGPGAGGNGTHVDPNDDGGGGGGGFGTAGSIGGTGGTGGTPGTAGPAVTTTTLAGGSGGGGPPQGITCTNQGGGGGGAILIYAKHALTISGAINAGGGGGSAGILCPSPSMYASGGGGGAGGMIYLQTPDLHGMGILAANGGGGGGGACATGTLPTAGQDGRPSATMAAAGGTGSDCGTAGGAGAVRNGLTPVIPPAQYNGGGGGGGLGVVMIHAPSSTLDASPTATMVQ